MLHFNETFAFFFDQPLFATKALEIYTHRALVLIGPPTSFTVDSRYIFQGPATYYITLLFIILGKFDPLYATLIFIGAASLTVIPLYYGTVMLANKKAACLVVIVYTLLPFYITFSKFMWNPNFQLVFSPFLILCLGLYKKTHRSMFLFLAGVMAGFLLQFHYQFAIVVGGLLAAFMLRKKTRITKIIFFIAGICIGFSPLILFDFKHAWYNSRTMLLFVEHLLSFSKQSSKFSFSPHYVLSLSFLLLILSLSALKNKVSWLHVGVVFFILFGWSLCVFVPRPSLASRNPKYWTYSDELKVAQIIKSEKLAAFNVSTFYDSQAIAQKYFLKRDRVAIAYDDYRTNRYLFVVYPDMSFLKNPAYEINSFVPSKIIRVTPINDHYRLFLLERTNVR